MARAALRLLALNGCADTVEVAFDYPFGGPLNALKPAAGLV